MNRIYSMITRMTVMLCIGGLLLAACGPAFAADDGTVGRVSLVIGKAYRIRGDGERLPIRRGDRIGGGDRIETLANGHVHIRFDDQGLVSVRPQSRLIIEQYHYNPDDPARSTVKFHLEHGVVRSISGKAAKAARERFRMNTPIAAIGVRGTDFVVRADEHSLKAIVNEGVIVVAPFSDQCSAASLGPCASNAVELSGGSNQLLQLDRLQQMPQLVPLRDDIMPELIQRTNGNREQVAAETPAPVAPYSEEGDGKRADLFNETLVAQALGDRDGGISRTEMLKSRQLLWGRWSGAGAEDSLALGYSEASAGRKVTVGNDQYGLYRIQRDSGRVDPGLGALSFRLDEVQATFTGIDGGRSAVTVDNGSLEIDFTANRFRTTLDMHAGQAGAVNLDASGRLLDGGYFTSRTDTQRVGGAVSLDGREAAYYFTRQLPEGRVEGLTLWGAR